MKVYLIYLNNQLYAYTNDKKNYKKFKETRKKGIFNVNKVNMDEDRYEQFSFRNCENEIIEILLNDKSDDYIILGTVLEQSELENEIDVIHEEMREILSFFQSCNMKKKYMNIINELTNIVDLIPREDYIYDAMSNINTLHLFYTLNKETLSNIEDN